MSDKSSTKDAKKADKKEAKAGDAKVLDYCTLCKAAQIPDCGDRTPDNSGWDNAQWCVYANEEERKAADLLRKNAINLKELNMEPEESS